MRLLIAFCLIVAVTHLPAAQTPEQTSFQRELRQNSAEVCTLSWSPNGKWLATSTKALIKVDIWDMETQTLFRTLETHADVLSWNSQGDLLATLTHYEINIWDVESGENINTVDFGSIFQDELERGVRDAWPDRFTSIDWDDNTSQVAVVTRDWVGVWQLDIDEIKVLNLSELPAYYVTPNQVGWSHYGILAVTFHSDYLAFYEAKNLELIQIKAFEPFAFFTTPNQHTLSWNPDGTALAISGINIIDATDMRIIIYDLEYGDVVSMQGHTEPANAVVWSPTGEFIASGSGSYPIPSTDNSIRIWNTKTFEQQYIFLFESPIISISWHPEGKQLAAVDLSGTVYILEID